MTTQAEATSDQEQWSDEHKLKLQVYGMTRTPEGWKADVGVACPVKGRNVLLDECVDCARSFGFVTDAASGATYLRCGGDGDKHNVGG